MSDGTFSSPALPWSDSFSVGIEALDSDHRALVGLINEVCGHARAGRRERAVETLVPLCALAEAHFDREEAVLRDLSGYRQLAAHAGEHRNRLKQLVALRQRFESATDAAAADRICDDLVHWFVRQSIGHDAEIKSHLDDRGTRFSPLGGSKA